MAKGNVLQVIINSGLLTVNEIRRMEGLPEIENKWHEAMAGIGNSGRVSILESRSLKIVCLYCSRPNSREHDLCQSCGAPLSAT
jgi:hypothetical protein